MDQEHRQFVNPARWKWTAVPHCHTVRTLCRRIAIAAAFGLGLSVHLVGTCSHGQVGALPGRRQKSLGFSRPFFPLPAFLALLLVFSNVASSTAQTPLGCGTVVNASIDAPLELDVFTFTAEAGDIVTITFLQTQALDPGFSVRGLVYTPAGVLFANLTTLVGGINNLRITQPGTYTLRVSASDSTRRGSVRGGPDMAAPGQQALRQSDLDELRSGRERIHQCTARTRRLHVHG